MISPDFGPMVKEKWDFSSMRRPPDVESLNASHGSLCFFRQYLKGWNIKHVGEQAKEKDALLDKLKQLDLIS